MDTDVLTKDKLSGKVCRLKFSGGIILDLQLQNSGVIKLISNNHRQAGLDNIHNIDIVIGKRKISLEYFSVSYPSRLVEEFCSELLRNNIYARVVSESRGYVGESKIRYSIKNPCEEIMLKLSQMKSYNFCFGKFVKIENNKLIFNFRGHQVGGSYVYEHEVVPGYIKQIQDNISKKVAFVERRRGGFGFDMYKFSVDCKL